LRVLPSYELYQWFSDGPTRVEVKKAKSQLHHFSVDGKSDDGLTLNSYVGCAHRCVYCYAAYEWTPNFYDVVVVRTNSNQLLERELEGWKEPAVDPVFLSSATDCYQPLEGKYRITRKCVETLQKHGVPYCILTKSSSIVRDLDLHASYRDKCIIAWSLTTLDDRVKKTIEPGASTAYGVLRALQVLSERGITTGVNIDPIIPGLTDDSKDLAEIVKQVSQHGAKFVNAAYLRLRPDIWDRLQKLFRDMGRPDVVSLVRSLYFEQPTKLNGYLTIRSDYAKNKLDEIRRTAQGENIDFGFPSGASGSSQCGAVSLTPKQLWVQVPLTV